MTNVPLRYESLRHEVSGSLDQLDQHLHLDVVQLAEADTRLADSGPPQSVAVFDRQVLAVFHGVDVDTDVVLLCGQTDDEPVDHLVIRLLVRVIAIADDGLVAPTPELPLPKVARERPDMTSVIAASRVSISERKRSGRALM